LTSGISTLTSGLATRIDNLQADVDLDLTGSKWLKKKVAGSKVKKMNNIQAPFSFATPAKVSREATFH